MGYYGDGAQGPAASVLTAESLLGIKNFVLLNGGLLYKTRCV